MEDERKNFPKATITIAGKLENGYYDEKGAIFYIADKNGDIVREQKVTPSQNMPAPAAEEKKESEKKKEKKGLFGIFRKKEKEEKTDTDVPKETSGKTEKKKVSVKPAYIYAAIGALLVVALFFLGAAIYRAGQASMAGLFNTNTEAPTTTVVVKNDEKTVAVMRAKKEIAVGEKISEENIESFEIPVSQLAKNANIQYSRLETYIEAGYVAASYIEEGRLIYSDQVQTSPVKVTNPWLEEEKTYFDVILTDSVLAGGGITFGKVLNITVYPKDAPDLEKIPEGITALTPDDPETKFSLTAVICNYYNEQGDCPFESLALLSKIPAKDQRHYLRTYLVEHPDYMEWIKPYKATIALTKAQADFLGDISRRGAITEMSLSDKDDRGTDAKKAMYNAITTLISNLDATANAVTPAPETSNTENTSGN